ncbi:restriction endonuclease [Peribacillus frigoritolerans]|uniref:nSTAND3 domain-containing NTPase n=1 Tax=Peribacillus frigoritolerans TaxID=450367 RepID=UPI002079B753|nr:restriction endonuclease [Peribacillus frigoritolerans]USK82567.1 restriction endonuclease [Peribacillus frigoritolerans]
MFNYNNLSPNEFEILCSDILSRELGIELRHFSPGRDGGVDLTESPTNKNVVVQVKHYLKSTYSSLKSSLEKELIKLQEMNPKPQKYYVCTSKELTAENIKEIYNIFKDYMESDKNILTKNEIDKLLNKDCNQDILKKNFKLWLVADQILTQLINRDIFIDGEVLLNNLEVDFKYFVQTSLFDQCLDILEKNRKILICGDPGVGKSITSKMLTFYFVKKGYQIRYTTNGLISDLKKSIQDNKDLKEVILLDDCLGQYYLKLREWQDRELISLLNYISISENKVLILNSRVTVLNEAQNSSGVLRRYLEDEKVKIKTINMNDISEKEKAYIFFNHLMRNELPNNYYDMIRANKNYLSIIKHKNYNPRIIEYVTHKKRYEKINPSEYHDFIIATLSNPQEVWSEEFRHGLAMEDRIFMHTLFSLTDTFVEVNVLEECFVKRIQSEGMIDPTRNIFEESKKRLTSSMIRIVENEGKLLIGVINPSLNDYMQNSLNFNRIEKEHILDNSLYVEQLERILGEASQERLLSELQTGEFLSRKSIDNKIPLYCLYNIWKFGELNNQYEHLIVEGILKMPREIKIFGDNLSKANIVSILLYTVKYNTFYKIKEKFSESKFRESVLLNLKADEAADLLCILKQQELNEVYYEEWENQFIDILENFINEFDLNDFLEYENVDDLEFYYENKSTNKLEYERELSRIKSNIEEKLTNKAFDLVEITEFIDENNPDVQKAILQGVYEKLEDEFEETVKWYLEPQSMGEYPNPAIVNIPAHIDELDLILDRPLE